MIVNNEQQDLKVMWSGLDEFSVPKTASAKPPRKPGSATGIKLIHFK
jgi:hypothetical protein